MGERDLVRPVVLPQKHCRVYAALRGPFFLTRSVGSSLSFTAVPVAFAYLRSVEPRHESSFAALCSFRGNHAGAHTLHRLLDRKSDADIAP